MGRKFQFNPESSQEDLDGFRLPGIPMMRRVRHSAQRNPKRVRHLLSVLRNFGQSWLRLKWRRALIGKPMVCIGMLEHIGDIVATQPIAKRVRDLNPDADIVWVVNRRYRDLLAADPDIDHVHVVSCLTEYMLLWQSGVFDRVYDLHINGRMCLKCCIPIEKTGSAEALGLDNYYNDGRSLFDVACISAGLVPFAAEPCLHPLKTASAVVDSLSLPKRYVAVHRQSNESERDWDDDRWDEVIRWLTSVVCIDVVEVGVSPRIHLARTGNTVPLPKVQISETTEIIRQAVLFVGIDSGPAHIANATRCPAVILLGSYRSFGSYNPYSGFFRVGGASFVQPDVPAPARGILTGAVIEAISARLNSIERPASAAATADMGYAVYG